MSDYYYYHQLSVSHEQISELSLRTLPCQEVGDYGPDIRRVTCILFCFFRKKINRGVHRPSFFDQMLGMGFYVEIIRLPECNPNIATHSPLGAASLSFKLSFLSAFSSSATSCT